jgi:hypothetical protein
LFAGGGAFLVFAYPGLLTQDSVDQLVEARAGFFTDAHPPAMAALWRLFDALVAGPFAMLLVQGSTFLIGCYLLLKRAMSARRAALAASLFLLFPPVLTTMAVIWKDPLMAGLTMFGTALLLEDARRRKLVGLAVLTLATAVKYNALAAILPLVVLLFEWSSGRALRRYAIATATWFGITLAAMGTNRLLTDQPMHFWHSTLAVWDITGTLSFARDLPDEVLRERLAGTGLLIDVEIQAHARRLYANKDLIRVVFGDQKLWDLPTKGRTPAPEAQRDAIAAAWWATITAHPSAYLRHRLSSLLDVLGVTYQSHGAVPARVLQYAPPAELGLVTSSSRLQRAWSRTIKRIFKHTPLFRPWIYVVVAIVLLGFCERRRDRDVIALLASGLLAVSSLFWLSPSPDYRYMHWTIASTCLAAIMLAARRASAAGPQG